jgi:hypothetical protein
MTPEMAVEFLRARSLIDARDVVEGDLAIEEATGRNANLRIGSRTGRNFFIKRAPDRNASLLRVEAALYAHATRSDDWSPLRPFLPRVHSFDEEQAILVMHRSPSALDVFDVDSADDTLGLPAIAGLLGAALAAAHSVPADNAGADAFLGLNAPWALTIHQPSPSALSDLWPGQVHVLRAIQEQSWTGELLDQLGAGWRRTALMHGDLKFTNVLVETTPPGGVPAGVVLVDWETASVGDPAWDVGSVLQSYLWFAVFLVSLLQETPAEGAGRAFGERLPAYQREMRTFWDTYVAASTLPPNTAAPLLERAIIFCGVRLLQTAWELAQGEDTPGRLTSGALQLGLNILRRPGNAASQLIGIGLDREPA